MGDGRPPPLAPLFFLTCSCDSALACWAIPLEEERATELDEAEKNSIRELARLGLMHGHTCASTRARSEYIVIFGYGYK